MAMRINTTTVEFDRNAHQRSDLNLQAKARLLHLVGLGWKVEASVDLRDRLIVVLALRRPWWRRAAKGSQVEGMRSYPVYKH